MEKYVQEIKQNPLRIIGACAPSSQALARSMTRFVCSKKKQNILEVGAGTGAVTHALVQAMGPSHSVDVVEIYPFLVNRLKKRFSHISQVNIHGVDILKFETKKRYDVIISSLPFNAMIPEIVEPIIKRLVSLGKSQTIMSFYEYKILQNIVKPFLKKEQLASYLKTRYFIDKLISRYEFDKETVKFNIPPACVHYLELGRK